MFSQHGLSHWSKYSRKPIVLCGFAGINLTQKNNHTDFSSSSNMCNWITLNRVVESDLKCLPAIFNLKRHYLKQPHQEKQVKMFSRRGKKKARKRNGFIAKLKSKCISQWSQRWEAVFLKDSAHLKELCWSLAMVVSPHGRFYMKTCSGSYIERMNPWVHVMWIIQNMCFHNSWNGIF